MALMEFSSPPLHDSLEILAGVAHIHAHDIEHRDIKPANVFFRGVGAGSVNTTGATELGEWCIGDFSLARLGASSADDEAEGEEYGTYAYTPRTEGGSRGRGGRRRHRRDMYGEPREEAGGYRPLTQPPATTQA